MKLKSILSIFAIVALSAACTREEPVSNPDQAVKITPSVFTISKDAGAKEIALEATEDWCIWFDADWITITPDVNKEEFVLVPEHSNIYFFKPGNYTVKINVAENTGKERTAQIVFDPIGPDKKILTVTQEGGEIIPGLTPDDPMTVAQAIAYCKPLGDKEKSSKSFYVKGIIVDIVEEFGTTYGNATFWITDDGKKDSPKFEVYRCLYLDNVKYDDTSKRNIKVGDQVVVYGIIMNYGGQAETSQNEAYLYSLEEGTSPVLTTPEAKVAVPCDATSATFTVNGQNLKGDWTVTTDAAWITDYTRSGSGNGTIEVSFEANTGEARTATFTVSSPDAEDLVLTLAQAEFSEKGTIYNPYTVAEALAIIDTMEDGVTADFDVYVRGVVFGANGIDTGYGNATFQLIDEGVDGGPAITVFRAWNLGNIKFAEGDENAFAEGDNLLVKGKLQRYVKNEVMTPELSKGYVVTINGKTIPEGDGSAEAPYNVTKLAQMLLDGEVPETEVYAKGIICKIDSISWDVTAEKYYGNAQYWISDDGSRLFQMESYRGFYFGGAKFTAEDQIKVGDEVVIYGKVKLYVKDENKTPEFDANNYLVSINGKTE